MREYPVYLSSVIINTVMLREIGKHIRAGAEIRPHIVRQCVNSRLGRKVLQRGGRAINQT